MGTSRKERRLWLRVRKGDWLRECICKSAYIVIIMTTGFENGMRMESIASRLREWRLCYLNRIYLKFFLYRVSYFVVIISHVDFLIFYSFTFTWLLNLNLLLLIILISGTIFFIVLLQVHSKSKLLLSYIKVDTLFLIIILLLL